MLADLAQAGVPHAEAAKVARLSDLDGSVGLARLARDLAIDTGVLTRAFSDLGARLGLDWAQQAASRLRPTDSWERLLVAGLARDFQHMRLDFLRRLCGRKGCDPAAMVEQWAGAQAVAIRQFRAMVTRAQGAVPTAPAMLAQIAGQARNLLGR
jgi:glutamate dehydrogenase